MTRRGAYSPGSPGSRVATLGQRIKAVRKAWGWTQQELAILLHVPQGSVSQWECGKSRPIGPVQAHLLSLFKVSEEALIHGKGFTIPDMPQGPTDVSTTVVIGRETATTPIQLPAGRPGKAWCLPLASGTPRLLSREEARAHLERVLDAGGSLWILDQLRASE